MLARNILGNDRLSPVGRHLICVTLEEEYKRYKSVINYVADHPSTTEAAIRSLLIICGLPRTSTTLLYNLLACDSACRPTLVTEMLNPIPPLARSAIAAQMGRNNAMCEVYNTRDKLGLNDNVQDFRASHPLFKYKDLAILAQADLHPRYYSLAPSKDNELVKWFLNDGNKDFVDEYHKTFIQMLNSVDAPQSHWLLKGPVHTLYLNTLLRYYPSTSLIMSHQRLDEVIPSICRLGMAFTSACFDSNSAGARDNKNTLIELCLLLMDTYISRLIEFHRNKRHSSVFDILYDDLFSERIEIVRQIYQYFGLTWSEDFERTMLVAWIRDNLQGKQERDTYTLDVFGLKSEEIEKRYEEYNTLFLTSQNRLKKDDHLMKSDSFSPKNN